MREVRQPFFALRAEKQGGVGRHTSVTYGKCEGQRPFLNIVKKNRAAPGGVPQSPRQVA